MSALNRTNNRYRVAIEFVSIVEGGEVGRMQGVIAKSGLMALWLMALGFLPLLCHSESRSIPNPTPTVTS